MSEELLQYLGQTSTMRKGIVSKAAEVIGQGSDRYRSRHRRCGSLDESIIGQQMEGIIKLVMDESDKRTQLSRDLFTISEKPKYKVSEDVKKFMNGVLESNNRPLSSYKAANRAMRVNKAYLKPIYTKRRSPKPSPDLEKQRSFFSSHSPLSSILSIKTKQETSKPLISKQPYIIRGPEHLHRIYLLPDTKLSSRSSSRRTVHRAKSRVDDSKVLSKSLDGLPEDLEDPTSTPLPNRPNSNLPTITDRFKPPKPSHSRSRSSVNASPNFSYVSYNIPSMKTSIDLTTPVLKQKQGSFQVLRNSSITPFQADTNSSFDFTAGGNPVIFMTHL
jgi:hypothetical protein